MITTIYTLAHPLTGEIRYIGKTVQKLKYRLTQHLTEKSNHKRANWIKSLKKQNLKPMIESLEECSWEESSTREIYWISQFKTWGFRLTNLTEGGDGNLGLKPTEEAILKLKASLKEYYKTHTSAMKGKKHSEESKRNMRENRKPAVFSKETREKMSKSRMGKRLPLFAVDRMIEIHGRRVVQLDKDLNLIATFYTIKDASIAMGKPAKTDGHIVQCCQNKRPIAYGFKWMYEEEYYKLIEENKVKP